MAIDPVAEEVAKLAVQDNSGGHDEVAVEPGQTTTVSIKRSGCDRRIRTNRNNPRIGGLDRNIAICANTFREGRVRRTGDLRVATVDSAGSFL
jgi:hypothetical protein